MSRLEFRAAVDAPRPASAWVMVAVASVTLWVTRQLAPWAVAAQAAAIILSLGLRRRPHRWQRSPVALNLGMLAVVAVTVWVALQRHPSSVALAHFAGLTQGLQLLDARPRRSEFLLVALALFQVLLASSLTDSILFVPLLGAFVVSTAWTLIVHTLRTEALEAGRPAAVTRAITPGLLRTTFLASGASMAVALVLFVLLPRMQSSLTARAGLEARGAVVGFSDRVELGDLGRIRQDRSVVLRVETLRGETLEPEDAYWRGLAFDRFDGQSWSVTPRSRRLLTRNAELGIGLGRTVDVDRVERIVREPVASGVLFRAGEPRKLQGVLGVVEADVNGGLYAPARAHQRLRYTVATRTHRSNDDELRRDRARPPPGTGARMLALPPLDPRVSALAAEIVEGQPTDADRVRAIERYLRATGRYTDTPPSWKGDAESPVEAFLFGERAGHCEYFASAMVILARSLGIPARLVNGFAGGERNPIGGFLELTRADAHAWVEVHYERAGWVRYDPTPLDLRLRAGDGLAWIDSLRSLGSAIELWWFQRVVDFDRSDQMLAWKSGWRAWRRLQSGGERREESGLARLARWLEGGFGSLPGLLIVGLGGAVGIGWHRWRRAARSPERRLPAAYRRALRLLRRRGLVRPPAATALDFSAAVARELPPPAAAEFEALTRAYLEERFAGRGSPEGAACYRRLRRALRAPHSSPARISQH